ncbi:hypothetical protein [Nonomuraea cavernae]|uniref:Thioredoxin domain-containing protein n=1 Tax=Nonomuraea cavernae TaxID=2045107 RepID=A0A917ZBC3_9ACTN|nr:hypothetical protein [Nonomuraea cavernae]MCA2186376.1 hypothetical protein [Nonomuraea cavernae]GGO79316.1 hypothetical protein GCM10012289_63330 [Nonomuraea cavernae]
MDPTSAAVIVLGILVALLFAAGAGLYRRVRELEMATYNGVGVRFGAGQDEQVRSAVTTPNGTTLVVKVNRQCSTCEDVLLAVGKLAPELPGDHSFAVVSDDPGFDKSLPAEVRVIKDPAIWRSVTVPYAPALLIVDAAGLVVFTAPLGSGDALVDVVERTVLRRRETQP